MLQAHPTKNGTGVMLSGDYNDLMALYEIVHHVAGNLNEDDKYQKGRIDLLMNFAHEVRKAYMSQRLTHQLPDPAGEITYYGFQTAWPDMVLFISVLRYCAGFTPTGKLHQAILYLLEGVVEEALFDYDPEGAVSIRVLMNGGLRMGHEFLFLIYQAVHIDFVSQRPGKARFRKIPKLMWDYLDEQSQVYRELMRSLEKSARAQGGAIGDLSFNEFPEIKW